MQFNLKDAIAIANQATFVKTGRRLTDVEILILEGAWNREEYDQTAAKHQYATSYISQDAAPKLWKALSDALGEKVKKSNFKEALKRYWEIQQRSPQPSSVPESTSISSQPQVDQIPSQPDRRTVKPDVLRSDRYVERPPIESICYNTLLQPGSLLRVKAPKLMGKTLLMNRVLAQLAAQNYQTIHLSFKLADRIHFTDLDKFLRWFCMNLTRELGLSNQLNEYWDEVGMGSKVSCTTYVEDYLLAESDCPLVLCLDDVDAIFPYPEVYEDVFGLLRSWYEKAGSRQTWENLRLVIVHSTDVYIQLNIHQSPFNVGLPIELPEFTLEQATEFAKQHGLTGEKAIVEPLMSLVGGHPYLLEQAFSYLKRHSDLSISQFLSTAPTDAGIYANHLREHWSTVQRQPELTKSLKTVMTATRAVQLEPIQTYQLHSMGLVKLSGNLAEPRCDLYRQYFCTHLKGEG